jgi:hypothetical protein
LDGLLIMASEGPEYTFYDTVILQTDLVL